VVSITEELKPNSLGIRREDLFVVNSFFWNSEFGLVGCYNMMESALVVHCSQFLSLKPAGESSSLRG
jgi:hypothetical protein